MCDKKSAGGLADIIAGETAIATVGKEGAGLTYRGYDIEDMAKNATFDEVAYLLHHGDLPNRGQLEQYRDKLKGMRGLPQALKDVLENTPADSHPMDVLRSGCSVMGNLEPEGDFSNQVDVADRLLACLPSMLLYVDAHVLASLSHRWCAYRHRNRGRFDRRSFSAPVARQAAQ